MRNARQGILILLALPAAAALADTTGTGSAPGRPDQPPVSAELKAAFEACKSAGRPGETAFEACMTSKGFTRPTGDSGPPAGKGR